MEFEEGEGLALLSHRGRWRFKHLIQFELSKKESPLKEAVVEGRHMRHFSSDLRKMLLLTLLLA